MLTANTALQTEQDALMAAVGAVLEPLAQLCVARGLPIQAVEEQIRQTFVRAALQAHETSGAAPNTSRLSAATGLTRREITRLLEAQATQHPRRPSPSSQVFTRWLTDPALRDQQQRPLALPRQGSAPSFEALAQSVTRDVRPRTLLEELCRLNLVRVDPATDQVLLNAESFVPRGDWARMVNFLGQNVGDHLRAATTNVLGDGQQHFEQAIHADELSAQSIGSLHHMVSREWKQLLDTLVPQIEALIEQDRQASRAMNQQIRIGFFSWTEPMPSPVSSQQGAPHEQA
ncbi:DUF6502 family protein [Hydrogenophaga sp.]|uniref:DUF6502 family protein n=1 Tax=Hydrogenophaga sp. TaxID=1904254 RepID=UPI00261F82E6|nr:DUF6502 family protein [Hydrogenophaga sp.]MDM7950113.1 DUF6502 family protein [Hydrogenophaga sp.]